MKLTTKTAQAIMALVYGNTRNFMTPNIIRVDKIGETIAYEVSQGEGITGNVIFGFSVVDYDPATGVASRNPTSGCFHSLMDIAQEIEKLGGNPTVAHESKAWGAE